jgi:hypothetical protein
VGGLFGWVAGRKDRIATGIGWQTFTALSDHTAPHAAMIGEDMDCSFIAWCDLKPEAQAAWVQAVFSVLAIAFATWVPFRMDKRRRRERDDENGYIADELALELHSAFLEWHKRVEQVSEKILKTTTSRLLADEIDGSYSPSIATEKGTQFRAFGKASRQIFAAFAISRRLQQAAQQLRRPENYDMSEDDVEELDKSARTWIVQQEKRLLEIVENFNARLDTLGS